MNATLAFVKRRRVALATMAAAFIVYAAVGFLLVPRLAQNAIASYVRETLQRQIAIGDLTFNPFTLTAEVRDLDLREADGSPIAAFKLLRVNAELRSLLSLAPHFKEIRLIEPRVALVILTDGALNLAKLAPRRAPDDPSDKAEGEPPAVRIDTFALQAGRIDIEDRTRAQPFSATLQPITFDLRDFRTNRDHNNLYSFAASSEHGETFEWSGEFSVLPLRSSGKFAVGKLMAQTIADYLQEQLPLQLASGVLDIDGAYQIVATDSVELRIRLPSVRIQQLGIAAKGEAAPWITVPRIEIASSEFSLANRSVHIGSIRVEDARIDAWREADGHLNLLRLAPAAAPAPVTAPEPRQADVNASENAEWHFKLGVLEVKNATMRGEDRTVSPVATVALSSVDAKIDNIDSAPATESTITSSLAINENGRLTIQGAVQNAPLIAKFAIGAQAIDLLAAQPYLNASTGIRLRQGKFEGTARIEYREQPGKGEAQLTVAGDVGILNFGARDTLTKEELLAWRSLRVDGLRYSQAPDRLEIARIALAKPYARVVISKEGQLNLATALQPTNAATAPDVKTDAATTPTSKAANAPPMPMRIRQIRVDNGDMYFADFSVDPSFATGMNTLSGQVTGLSSDPRSRAAVQLEGNVDRYAPVSIVGTLNVLSADTYSDIGLKFSNMELTTFNPYSGKFAGYNIEKGKLSTELHYLVQQRKLDAKHHIVLDQLEFGAATESKDAVPMPIKFAVALLKDTNGVITLDLPVSGTLDDPTFRVGPIVWQALKNILTKITTAPFAAIGALFGGGDELQFIEFAPGSAALNDAQLERIKKLSQALVARPQLQLDVPLTATAPADNSAVARAAFDRALAITPLRYTGDDPKRIDDARLKALTDIYVRTKQSQPTFPPEGAGEDTGARIAFLERELLAALVPSAEQLNTLARERGVAVQSALLAETGVPADRVFLTTRANEAESSEQTVRMELKLENR